MSRININWRAIGTTLHHYWKEFAMNKQLATRYSNQQLEQILEEAVVYMCACPAQVCEQLLQLRKLFDYQSACISKGSLLAEVHCRISDATVTAHVELEQCLADVLDMEGWDLQTLTMPAGLRELRQQSIDQD
jgi:hypothetical protein